MFCRIGVFTLLAGVAFAQSAGTVLVTTTVTATAGAGATAVNCVMNGAAKPQVRTTCSIGSTVVLTQDVTPAVSPASGTVGSFTNSGNTVTWTIQQDTAGNVQWQIAANGVSKTGTF